MYKSLQTIGFAAIKLFDSALHSIRVKRASDRNVR